MASLKIYKTSVLNTNRDWFDYTADTCLPQVGMRVWVPFKNSRKVGLITAIEDLSETTRPLKTIISIIDDEPLISEHMLALSRWISNYYQSPLSEVFALLLPKKYRLGQKIQLPHSDYYALESSVDKKLIRSKKQQQVLEYLITQTNLAKEKRLFSKNELLATGVTKAVLNQLVKKSLITQHMLLDKPSNALKPSSQALALNAEQTVALQVIASGLHGYHCFVLQGVTGSGKTEVYLQVIAKVLAMGKQVLILVPEIGLTPQLLARFSSRFPEPMVVIHSNLNDTERQQAWQLAHDHLVKLVIGTRSAIFTPMRDLGLIVIDEEHDLSLKQMEGVRYSAKDTALMKAYMMNIPIILGSATPSLETLQNCRLSKYTLVRLNQKALNDIPVQYQIIDIRNQPLQQGIAEPTRVLIDAHIQQGNQVLVFINRRGFSPVFLCHQCGWIADCRACDTHLTYHRAINKLCCHHCGMTRSALIQCQSCRSRELLPIGVGTQRIQTYLSTLYPTTSILRIDRDEVQKKDQLERCLAQIYAQEAQLIVGTQMMAKGHHFPRLTLVVIVDADHGFYNQDFRSLERLGQLLIQVSGRTGRAELPGQVVIQTHFPQHPLLNQLIQEGYDAFADALLTLRQQACLPPFHFLAMLRVQGPKLERVLNFTHQVKDFLTRYDVITLGPAPAPVARKAEQYRMQLMIKSGSRKKLNHTLQTMRSWIAVDKLSAGLRWSLDVDPMDLS